MSKQYLGDSVYVEHDGFGLRLTTENGLPTDPSNDIYLEPNVYHALVTFVNNLRAESNNSGDGHASPC
jgi:hypothetical protein